MDTQTSKEFHKRIRIQNAEILSDGNSAKFYNKSKTISEKKGR
jgi:hypothetical protein